MPGSAELEALYRDAAAATSAGSRSFYFATRFFPPDLARAAHAVYWFCRYTDDLVDECDSVEQGRRDLEEWSVRLRWALDGGAVEHQVLQLFTQSVRNCDIPHEYPLELIEGMRMDLAATRYRTFAELRVFCYRVASVVGLMMCHAIGFEDPALVHATDLGIAMQLTNILRDVGEDLARGRLYLPSAEMESFGCTESDLDSRRCTDAFRQLMQFQAGRARDLYERAMPGVQLLKPRGQFAVRIAAELYRDILREIERNGYDVFHKRAVVPGRRKLWLTGRSMAIPVARRSAEWLMFWRAGQA